MWIIKSFLRLIKDFISCLRCRRRVEGAESDPLLSSSDSNAQRSAGLSLSDGYRPYESTNQALYVYLLHLTLYLTLAIVAYSFVFEKWSIVDSIYFATVVFTTIGYGDLSPSTDAGRLFTVVFAIHGIAILSAFIARIGKAVIAMGHEATEKARIKGRKSIMNMFRQDASDHEPTTKEKNFFQELWHVVVLETPTLLLLCTGAILMGMREGWTVITSIYYGVITSTTIGFGDLHPDSEGSRLIAILFLPFSVAVFGEVLSRVAGLYIDRHARATEREFLRRHLTLVDLKIMDVDKDGAVSWGEFLSFMLLAMQKVDQSDVDEVRALFQSLDATGDGTLDKKDLVALAEARRKKLQAAAATLSSDAARE